MEGVQQIEFAAQGIGEGANPLNGATASGQAEGDLIVDSANRKNASTGDIGKSMRGSTFR